MVAGNACLCGTLYDAVSAIAVYVRLYRLCSRYVTLLSVPIPLMPGCVLPTGDTTDGVMDRYVICYDKSLTSMPFQNC